MVVNPLKGKSLEEIAAMARAKRPWAVTEWRINNAIQAAGQGVPPIIQNAMGSQWTPRIQQPMQWASGWFANPFSQWADGDVAMAGRRASTVATPNNPVMDRTIKPWNLQYDPNDPTLLLWEQTQGQHRVVNFQKKTYLIIK